MSEQAQPRILVVDDDPVILRLLQVNFRLEGYEVCRRLKEDPETAAAPVIFLSARAQDADRDRGYALGVVAYVTKPFDPGQLVDVVRRATSADAD